jgi:hypothetical protein
MSSKSGKSSAGKSYERDEVSSSQEFDEDIAAEPSTPSSQEVAPSARGDLRKAKSAPIDSAPPSSSNIMFRESSSSGVGSSNNFSTTTINNNGSSRLTSTAGIIAFRPLLINLTDIEENFFDTSFDTLHGLIADPMESFIKFISKMHPSAHIDFGEFHVSV